MSSGIFDLDQGRNVSTRSTEWHGFARIPGGELRTVDEIMEFSGADFRVLQEPREWHGQIVEDQFDNFTVVTTDQGLPRPVYLGTVGPKYIPQDNRQAIKPLETALRTGLIRFETCGTLQNLKKFFCCFSFGSQIEVVPNDPIWRVIVVLTGHDGTTSYSLGISNIRVVCLNTWRATLVSKIAEFFTGRHTAGLEVLQETWIEMIDFEQAQFIDEMEQMKFLASKQLTGRILDDFVRATVSGKRLITPELIREFELERLDRVDKLNAALAGGDPKLIKRLETDKLAKTKEALERLLETGAGSNIPGVSRSLYGLDAAYKEWRQYEAGQSETTTADRFNSIITPGGNLDKDLALATRNLLALAR